MKNRFISSVGDPQEKSTSSTKYLTYCVNVMVIASLPPASGSQMFYLSHSTGFRAGSYKSRQTTFFSDTEGLGFHFTVD